MDFYYLYFSRINQFLFLFKLINTFEKNLMNYFFDELFLGNSLFNLLLNYIVIIILNIIINTYELNYANRKQNDNAIAITNVNFTNKKNDTEQINFLNNLSIEYKFILEQNSFIIINQYIKITIIKFCLFNVGTDKKVRKNSQYKSFKLTIIHSKI